MSDMKINVDLQNASASKQVPPFSKFEIWVNAALRNYPKNAEICIRVIDEPESQQLNSTYRHKNYPTNVLSFPYDDDKSHLLGDIAICASIIEKEAKEQNINIESHWAHIVIHGCLHLIGYTHDTDKNAEKMESLEAKLCHII